MLHSHTSWRSTMARPMVIPSPCRLTQFVPNLYCLRVCQVEPASDQLQCFVESSQHMSSCLHLSKQLLLLLLGMACMAWQHQQAHRMW